VGLVEARHRVQRKGQTLQSIEMTERVLVQTPLGRVEETATRKANTWLRPMRAFFSRKGRILDAESTIAEVTYAVVWEGNTAVVTRREGEKTSTERILCGSETVADPATFAPLLLQAGPGCYVFETLLLDRKGSTYVDDYTVLVKEEAEMAWEDGPVRAVEVVMAGHVRFYGTDGALLRTTRSLGRTETSERAATPDAAEKGLGPIKPELFEGFTTLDTPVHLVRTFVFALVKKDAEILARCIHWETVVKTSLEAQGKDGSPENVRRFAGMFQSLVTRQILLSGSYAFSASVLLTLTDMPAQVKVTPRGAGWVALHLPGAGKGDFEARCFGEKWRITSFGRLQSQ
jgi:hypothetical protein